jgi:hypothetical protein
MNNVWKDKLYIFFHGKITEFYKVNIVENQTAIYKNENGLKLCVKYDNYGYHAVGFKYVFISSEKNDVIDKVTNYCEMEIKNLELYIEKIKCLKDI